LLPGAAILGTAVTVQTGFYCVQDSTGDQPPAAVPPNPPGFLGGGTNNGLGLPSGSARIVVIDNTFVNCPDGSPGSVCGFQPAAQNVSIAAGAVATGIVALQNKLAPT